MTTLTVTEVDCSTGVSTQRPMTAEEITTMEEQHAYFEAQQAAAAAEAANKAALKASAKAKLVAGQPLTEEEASVLVI
jgi:hypothetical protein